MNTSKERIRNPLIGSFTIAWVTYNWDSLLILFYSELAIEERISVVSPKSGFLEPGFWWPFFIALIYIIAVPYLLIGIDLLTDDSFRKRKIRASNRRVAELKSSIEVVKAEVEHEKLRTEFKDVTQLNEKIQALTDELKEKQEMKL